jgi:hypothetical protein
MKTFRFPGERLCGIRLHESFAFALFFLRWRYSFRITQVFAFASLSITQDLHRSVFASFYIGCVSTCTEKAHTSTSVDFVTSSFCVTIGALKWATPQQQVFRFFLGFRV